MKVRTTKKMYTPIGNIITHKSPGGTETHERTGLLGILDIVQAIKTVMQQKEKEKEVKQKAEKHKSNEQKVTSVESLFNNQDKIKSPRTRKFLGNRVWMASPGGLPAPVAFFNVHNGGNGMSEVHERILKVLRKAIDKKPITSRNVSNLNKNISYNKTVSPYTPLDNNGIWREGGDMAKEIKEATKKRQRTLSIPMSREKELPNYALKTLKDVQALRKIRGLMRGKRFNSKKNIRLHENHEPFQRYSKPMFNKNMKVVGTYKRPSAAKIYKRLGTSVLGRIFSIPKPPNGKRLQDKQLCLRKVKNKKQAYFAPIGTCPK